MGESRKYKVYGSGTANRIVLPAEVARQVDIKPGDFITWTIDRDELRVKKCR